MFYNQHNLSAEMYIEEKLKSGRINYISSPEVGFLKAIGQKLNNSMTKLVFVLPETNAVEPTTNETYGSLLKNLTGIKSFASGIMVPKSFIYSINQKTMYLEPPTTLVTDAHKEGLEVYASGFANDVFTSHNYTYEPTAEYQKFIDNSQFAVDGFLTDFPPTASEAIGKITFFHSLSTCHVMSLNFLTMYLTSDSNPQCFSGCSMLCTKQRYQTSQW